MRPARLGAQRKVGDGVTNRHLSATDEKFVAEVARLLRQPNIDREIDMLTAMSMGATIPAEPIRVPDPECRECWGSGWICSCHGFAWSYSNTRGSGCYLDKKREKCKCWRAVHNEEDRHG